MWRYKNFLSAKIICGVMDAKFYPNKEDTAYELSNKEDRSSFKKKKRKGKR